MPQSDWRTFQYKECLKIMIPKLVKNSIDTFILKFVISNFFQTLNSPLFLKYFCKKNIWFWNKIMQFREDYRLLYKNIFIFCWKVVLFMKMYSNVINKIGGAYLKRKWIHWKRNWRWSSRPHCRCIARSNARRLFQRM